MASTNPREHDEVSCQGSFRRLRHRQSVFGVDLQRSGDILAGAWEAQQGKTTEQFLDETCIRGDYFPGDGEHGRSRRYRGFLAVWIRARDVNGAQIAVERRGYSVMRGEGIGLRLGKCGRSRPFESWWAGCNYSFSFASETIRLT